MKPLERAALQRLRENRPAWRLLAATHAPFVIAFLHQAFLDSNVRTAPMQGLVASLEDHLLEAREQGRLDLPKSAEAYLDAWAHDDSGWLRKFYPPGQDEPHFDLTPDAERAIRWVMGLQEQRVVGTESRLQSVLQLLATMEEGAEADPAKRLADLQRRRDALDAEMAALREGHVVVMDDVALRERFHLVSTTARELLADFRELEQSFHLLDRQVRQRIAGWDGGRGALLDDILGERDAIASSDQGASFRAFWDFLMSPDRQEDFTARLERVFALPAIRDTAPDPRLRRVHYDWLEAGEVTQRTVARLSEQLRRYLDDRVFLENRRIMELVRLVEQQALAMRDTPPTDTVGELDDVAPAFELPLERPLFSPPYVARLARQVLEAADEDVPADGLFEQVAIDRARLQRNVRQLLLQRERVTLLEVLTEFPLQHGLAELVGYFAEASEDRKAVIDEASAQDVTWTDRAGRTRRATLPLVLFHR